MTKRYLLLLFFLLSFLRTNISYGQNMDTLNYAKELRDIGERGKSINLLKTYYGNHKKELYAGWFFADALFKNKEYDKASRIYNETIRNHPKNIDLRLDYAIKSTEIGMFREALFHLNKMNYKIPKDYKFAVKKTLAKIYFWQGKYKRSLSNIKAALSIYENDQESLKLRKEISKIQSNWMRIDASYTDNNQPLTIMSPNIEMGFYHNSALSSKFEINSSFYSKDYKMYYGGGLTGALIYHLLNYKTTLELGVGLIGLPSNTYNIAASLLLKKKIFKHTEFIASYNYTPYLSTIASIDKKVMQNILGVSLERNNTSSWMGKISFDTHNFPSIENSYYALSTWIVSPNIKLSQFSFRIGYGFNYSDSKNNSFNSKLSLKELLSMQDTAVIIKGVYDPFFSPQNQKIHSVVGMISYQPTKSINVGININYGVKASADTPYLFLDNNENSGLYIKRDYFDRDFNPVEVNGYLSYQLDDFASVKAYYKYQKTTYYTSYITGLTTKFLF